MRRPEIAPVAPSRIIFDSPLVQVGLFRCPTEHPRFGDTGPTRVHCFVFPRTAVWIQHDGSRPFVADSAVVPLYNPGHPYLRRPISSDGDRTDWFGVSPALLREMLAARDAPAADAESRLFTNDYARATTAAFVRQRGIVQYVRRSETPDRLGVEENVIALLGSVLDEVHGPPRSRLTHRRDLVQDVRARIAATYWRRDDLTALAAAVDCSVFHLCRIFREHTGLTIHAYRHTLRLRKSLELLADSHDDLVDIAMALGFSSHSHFTASFRKSFRMTPSQYRTASQYSTTTRRMLRD